MFERSWTVAMRASGAITVETRFPDAAPEMRLEAWQAYTNATGGGAAFIQAGVLWVFEGALQAADCAAKIAQTGTVDCLMVIPVSGIGRVRIPSDIREITIYSDQAPNDVVAATLRVTSAY